MRPPLRPSASSHSVAPAHHLSAECPTLPQAHRIPTAGYHLDVKTRGESIDSVEKAFATGEENALKVAYAHYGDLVYTYCRRTLDESRAKDVTQEVFISAWRSRSRYDPARGALAGWLMAITKNRIIDNVRSEQRHSERRSGSDPTDIPIAAEVDRVGDRMMIAEALRCLPDRARQVIAMHYFDDLTHQQIAGRLSLPLGTVKSDLRRGLSQIRHQLESAHG